MCKGFAALLAAAQDSPRIETVLGYTYSRANSDTNVPAFSANGGSGQFVSDFGKHLGAVHSGNIGGAQIDNTTMNLLFGPRFILGYSRVRQYVQVLFGGAHLASSTQVHATVITPYQLLNTDPVIPGQPITARISANQTAFAMTAGGGLDIRAQGDNSQNSLRYTTGFNFSFGAQ